MPSGPRPSGCRSVAAETEPAAPWRECPAAASLLSQPAMATGGGGTGGEIINYMLLITV